MAQNKLGSHTFRPGQPVYIAQWASVAGKKEAEGPLGHGFDIKSMDTKFGEKTWEQAEKKMQQLALNKLLQKSRLKTEDIDLVCSGDLLNQCIGSSFTLRNTGIPHLGLYGACSTMAQSLLLASMAVGGGYADRAVAMTSSHFAGSERQYRFPLGYGGQRTPTAQWTVTGSGAALITGENGPVAIESATIGTVTDLGITDAANMGPAMAPVDVTLRPSPAGCTLVTQILWNAAPRRTATGEFHAVFLCQKKRSYIICHILFTFRRNCSIKDSHDSYHKFLSKGDILWITFASRTICTPMSTRQSSMSW